ncbi:MAG: hypothetical protein L0215_13545 [Gemmataceae bacterium]|nr:hypothetical protein [Gemmataceae bacterium]
MQEKLLWSWDAFRPERFRKGDERLRLEATLLAVRNPPSLRGGGLSAAEIEESAPVVALGHPNLLWICLVSGPLRDCRLAIRVRGLPRLVGFGRRGQGQGHGHLSDFAHDLDVDALARFLVQKGALDVERVDDRTVGDGENLIAADEVWPLISAGLASKRGYSR